MLNLAHKKILTRRKNFANIFAGEQVAMCALCIALMVAAFLPRLDGSDSAAATRVCVVTPEFLPSLSPSRLMAAPLDRTRSPWSFSPYKDTSLPRRHRPGHFFCRLRGGSDCSSESAEDEHCSVCDADPAKEGGLGALVKSVPGAEGEDSVLVDLLEVCVYRFVCVLCARVHVCLHVG